MISYLIIIVKTSHDASLPPGLYGPGSLVLLTAPSITSFVEDIRLAGQQVNPLGQLTGEREVQEVEVVHENGGSKYRVNMPMVGVALLVLKQEGS